MPSSPNFNSVTIIIRAAGERTEAACRQLILDQGVPEDQVILVREAPFSAALRRGFEIGIEQARPWTYCVDADVLLRPGSVARMLELAEQQDPETLGIQGYILDKFFGGPRQGGVHLYRTRLLPVALTCIPEEGVNIRPERTALAAMAEKQHPWVIVPYLTGLHDFEQYYRDIFRKCFVQAHKHLQYAELMLSVWRSGAVQDMDLQVALRAFSQGVEHWEAVAVDVRLDLYDRGFQGLEIEEKLDLPKEQITLGTIEHIITNWTDHPMHSATLSVGTTRMESAMQATEPPKRTSAPPSRRERTTMRVRELGILRFVPYAVGWACQRLGTCIQKLARRGSL